MAMGWKRMLLRAFGAKIAPTAVVYATTKVFQPWLLIMEDVYKRQQYTQMVSEITYCLLPIFLF